MTDMTAPSAERSSFLDRYFRLTDHGTDARTEMLAGVTTFLTMVYIVFVNPQILGNAGMDKGAVFVATCIAAAVSTLVMGLYANYPIALAPGMGSMPSSLSRSCSATNIRGSRRSLRCSARACCSF